MIRTELSKSTGLLLIALLGTGAAAADPTATIAMRPGIVVDAAGQRAFLAGADGKISAIALESGTALWRGNRTGLPLALVEGVLLAWGEPARRGQGRLLMVNAASGEVQEQVDFQLPEGVQANVAAQPQRSFAIRASSSLAAAGRVQLAWQYQERPLRGAWLATDDGVAPMDETVELSGLLDVDLAGQRVQSVAGELPADDPLLPAERQLRSLTATRQFRSADDAHVLTSSPVDHAQLGTVWEWRVHRFADAALATTVQLPTSYAPYQVVAGTLLVQLEPYAWRPSASAAGFEVREARLAAIDLASGEERWSVDVQDLKFRGVMPP